MTTETVGLYLTKAGYEAIRLIAIPNRHGKFTYSWAGKYGAGSGEGLSDYLKMIDAFKNSKRGMQTVMDARTWSPDPDINPGINC